jgi:nitrile hydratase beta subunit
MVARMNGIHDLGGMHGFGRVALEPHEPVFHAAWERRVLGMVYQVVGFGWANIDAFRHGIERMAPVEYLGAGYYGRWLASLETILAERGLLGAGEVDAVLAGRPLAARGAGDLVPQPTYGFVRPVDRAPGYAVGERVRARNVHPAGHTRLPRYVRGRVGVVHRVHAAFVFPDANAHGAGEQPQHLYTVRFDAAELWGPAAEPGATVHVDLFEPYLERV